MSAENSPLGKRVDAPTELDASVLFPVPRRDSRIERGIGEDLPFDGYDLWNCYEVSWLNNKGIPQVAMARIQYYCSTENIVESKSLKLFLGSFNNTRVGSAADVEGLISNSLCDVVGGECKVELILPDAWTTGFSAPDGVCIDDADPDLNAQILFGTDKIKETLHSNLLRSLCPVTGQPDWGTVVISYEGPQIDRATLLGFIISLRDEAGFHESLTEMIFMEIMEKGKPEKLNVTCNYTRRGGVDINPVRHSFGFEPKSEFQRLVRQ